MLGPKIPLFQYISLCSVPDFEFAIDLSLVWLSSWNSSSGVKEKPLYRKILPAYQPLQESFALPDPDIGEFPVEREGLAQRLERACWRKLQKVKA